MAKERYPREMDVADALKQHYQEVKMDTCFELALRNQTLTFVTRRAAQGYRRWTLGWAGAVILLFAAALMAWHYFAALPGNNVTAPAANGSHFTSPQLPGPAGHGNVALSPGKPDTRSSDRPDARALAAVKNTPEHHAPVVGSKSETPITTSKATAPKQDNALVVVVAAQSPVTDSKGRALKRGDRLADGEIIQTGNKGRVTLVTRLGSELTLNENSRVRLSTGGVIRLGAGEVFCKNRAKEITRIDTPTGQIQLLGTILDAAVRDKDSVSVIVLDGKVRLANSHGQAIVESGKQSLLSSTAPPETGVVVNTIALTSWYDGRGETVSEFGDVAYTFQRGTLTEVWAMKADGTGRHRVKTYLSGWADLGPWMSGGQWLFVKTYSRRFTTPNYVERRADYAQDDSDAIIRETPLTGRMLMLNIATGQEVEFDLPGAYRARLMSFSPNSRILAFTGQNHSDPVNWDVWENGLWTYDLATGKIDKLLDGVFWTKPAWSVDGRKIAVSTGEQDASQHRLIVVDTRTRDVIELNISGASMVFSPNNRKLAYLGGESMPNWYTGEAVYRDLFVVDQDPRVSPVKIASHEPGLFMPQWSPDGSRILYLQRDTMKVCVAMADGSGSREIYTVQPGDNGQPDRTLKVSWMPSGRSVYVLTSKELRTVAADGSGEIKTFRLDGSGLSQVEQAHTTGAMDNVREAIFQYAVGLTNEIDGKPGESLAAFQGSSNLFGELMWKYPLAQLSDEDVLRYADRAAKWANRSADAVISDACWQHLRCVRSFIGLYYKAHYADSSQVPPDLRSLEDFTKGAEWQIGMLSYKQPVPLEAIFSCPKIGSGGQTKYVYQPPQPGTQPNYREIIITCPHHPEHRIVWRALGLGQGYAQPYPAALGPILESDTHEP